MTHFVYSNDNVLPVLAILITMFTFPEHKQIGKRDRRHILSVYWRSSLLQFWSSVCVYVCVFMCVYIHIYVYIMFPTVEKT